MMVDGYTKVMLTVIAAALVALVLRPYVEPRQVQAQGGIVDVRIRGQVNRADALSLVRGWLIAGFGLAERER